MIKSTTLNSYEKRKYSVSYIWQAVVAPGWRSAAQIVVDDRRRPKYTAVLRGHIQKCNSAVNVLLRSPRTASLPYIMQERDRRQHFAAFHRNGP
ncbi:hypothetical protein EVAR_6252_1 [Eumeta japonica]|uniref:Uncharacterized protein n=1 Tax=Eumeta variegata TaxID=151549 RepID=A0A4C1TB98_EUMVA|nr:hypothetical protein EVAR_6252_1 [Eumeta japonica]